MLLVLSFSRLQDILLFSVSILNRYFLQLYSGKAILPGEPLKVSQFFSFLGQAMSPAVTNDKIIKLAGITHCYLLATCGWI